MASPARLNARSRAPELRPAEGGRDPTALRVRLFVLVEGGQESIYIWFQQIVGRGEAEFAGFAAADADFVFRPERLFQFHALDRREVVHGGAAAEHPGGGI